MKKKLVEFGYKRDQEEFIKKQELKIMNAVNENKPDAILFVNCFITEKKMKQLSKKYPIVFWAVDPIHSGQIDPNIKLCSAYVYDKQSEKFLNESGFHAKYCPVGYNIAYQYKTCVRNRDIIFVGSPYKHRCKILEQVAKLADCNGYTFDVYGKFFESPYFWKPASFRFKYPNLYKHIKYNGELAPADVAGIYQRAKIIINIHDRENMGLNPRTFDILATKSFELIDARRDYDILSPGKDVIPFNGTQQLLQKIKYYLQNEKERNRIAINGFEKVIGIRSMKECLRFMLSKYENK